MVKKIRWSSKTKVCPDCGKRKPATLKYFSPNKEGQICWCKQCVTRRAVVWGKNNKARQERNRQCWKLKKLYRISLEDYEALLESQNGVCAICKQHPERTAKKQFQRLHVDHDHKTLRVRGLLCFTCNAGLGNFKDDPDLLNLGMMYLKGAVNAV